MEEYWPNNTDIILSLACRSWVYCFFVSEE